MHSIHWLEENSPVDDFPNIEIALHEPNGLLAAGGDLSSERLLNAYRLGIFPWYSDGQPILWWSPDPRMVMKPEAVHVSRQMRRFIRKTRNAYHIRFNGAFKRVVESCAAPRSYEENTWITQEMVDAYCRLHDLGHAHCLEVWKINSDLNKPKEELIAGIYGIALGGVFFGESMFGLETNTSKLAFISLAKHLHHWGYQLLDGQVESEHLRSLGCRVIPREQFSVILGSACTVKMTHAWEVIPEILST